MAFSPAVAGSATAAPPNTSLLGSPAAQGDAMAGQADAIASIRQLSQQIDAFGSANPTMNQEVGAMKAILKQMILKAAAVAQTNTASGDAVPPAGGM